MFRGGAKGDSTVVCTVYFKLNIAKVALQHLNCNKDLSSGDFFLKNQFFEVIRVKQTCQGTVIVLHSKEDD